MKVSRKVVSTPQGRGEHLEPGSRLALVDERKHQLAFMQLPEELQEEIVSGLDAGKLTLRSSSILAKEKGHIISREAIRRYYQLLTHQRKHFEYADIIKVMTHQFAEMDARSALKSFLNLGISQLFRAVHEGQINLESKDYAKFVTALKELWEAIEANKGPSEGAYEGASKGLPGRIADITPETKRKVREELYGL